MKLSGVKVIDLSWFLPGPCLTMALADHGAEVIKVEPPAKAIPAATSRRWTNAPACSFAT
jgi:crotonobetainyl-CoA:carnitine CoA-transferase CaiB-like acyl-CoA transferase